MTRRLLLTCFSLGLILSTHTGHAVPLPPGSTVPLPGTTFAAEPQLGGVVQVDEVIPFSFGAYGGTVSGTVQVRVVRSDLDGTVDFYWRVFNDATSAGPITAFRIGDFVDLFKNVNWRIDGLGDNPPTAALRFSETDFPGGEHYVNFLFEHNFILNPGTESKFFFVDTEAQYYARTAFYDLTTLENLNISPSYQTYAPAPIPVPGTLLLFGSGLMGIGLTAWQRKRRV